MATEKQIEMLFSALLKDNTLDTFQHQTVLQKLDEAKASLPKVLVELKFVDEHRVKHVWSSILGFRTAYLHEWPEDKLALAKMDMETCLAHDALPLALRRNELHVAMADPSDVAELAALEKKTGCRIQPLVGGTKELRRAIRRAYDNTSATPRDGGMLAPLWDTQIEINTSDGPADDSQNETVLTSTVDDPMQKLQNLIEVDSLTDPEREKFRQIQDNQAKLQKVFQAVITLLKEKRLM